MTQANEIFAMVVVDAAMIALVGCAIALLVVFTYRAVRRGGIRRR